MNQGVIFISKMRQNCKKKTGSPLKGDGDGVKREEREWKGRNNENEKRRRGEEERKGLPWTRPSLGGN